ncbi:MAG: hypothetical protein IKM46_00370 [Clostridia bacterium]|nr:hypothetical protein [Clostridia bacterium]
MPFYKTDLHCHTSEGSYCAHESTRDTIERYIAEDFTSVAVTNHMVSYWCEVSKEVDPKGFETYEEYVDHIYDVIDLARECAAGRINVLCGIELCHCSSDNDYLIYGLTREMAKAYKLTHGSLRDMVKYVRSCGGVVIQAHPMRFEMTLTPPHEVDGYELYNNTKEWIYTNPIVDVWAAVNCLDKFKILTAGNDHHDSDDKITAGILTTRPIVSDEDLIGVLKSKDFTIFHETVLNCG